MKINDLIGELGAIQSIYGDIEVRIAHLGPDSVVRMPPILEIFVHREVAHVTNMSDDTVQQAQDS